MNPFSIPPLITSLSILFIAFIVYKKNRFSNANIIFCYFCLSLCFWLFGYTIMYNSNDPHKALFWSRVGFSSIVFIPILAFHFIITLLGLNYNFLMKFLYFLSVPSIVLGWTNNIYSDVKKYFWGYYPIAGKFYFIFLIMFAVLFTSGLILLILAIKKAKSRGDLLAVQQYKYVFYAFLFGTTGLIDYIVKYQINVYPCGYISALIFISIIAYAIIKYRLMDIKIVLTRVGIFLLVYSLCLGIPVWFGFKLIGFGLWLIPVTLMGIFATMGPFIYLFIQKRAEDRLLQEQRRYQATLRQASAGMGRIKDLKKLLSMIAYVLTHAIQIEHTLVYIYDENQKKYVLGAKKRKSGFGLFLDSIEYKSLLVDYFLRNRNPIIYEEINQKAIDFKDPELIQVEKIAASVNGSMFVPIFIDQDLTAIIVMGKKLSGKPYNEDDLSVFSILANQTALAIENARFYEDMKRTHQQLFQAEKMATIGTMADGLSHQVNNRFHALGFIAGDALDTIQMNKNELSPEKMKEIIAELECAFVSVQQNVVRGGEIVQGLLKYTRKGDAGFTAIDVDQVLKSALEMAQFKIKLNELEIMRDYDPANMPKIKGNFTQLQEVFFNLIDNGYDAMMQRKSESKEPGFQPKLIVRVLKNDAWAQVIFEDNGIGVKEEDERKLFTPFFTTKLSSKKGTGLGLYVIKKIVEENHGGNVEMLSKYMQGTQIKLLLPIAIV